jgi:hypothetical protein
VRVILAVFVALLLPATAAAQSAGTSQPATPKWEIEPYGGLSLGRLSNGGSVVLPEPGAPIVTSSPIFPSWRVPTWFLGDGTSFINDVASGFGLTSRITGLDESLAAPGTQSLGLPLLGVRIRRAFGSRRAIEFGFDALATNAKLSNSLAADVSAAQSSFANTFAELLATGPFTNGIVDASSTFNDGSSREIAVTGALVADLSPMGGWVPFYLVGGGVIMPSGTPPTATIEGRYRFTIAGSVRIDETDRATLRFTQRTVVAAVAGGGLYRPLSRRWTLRIDARLLIGPSTTKTAIDASPSVVIGTPAGFIESFTYPNLQFSNNPSTGRESTLSGSLSDFDAFKGGWQLRGRLTIGAAIRF